MPNFSGLRGRLSRLIDQELLSLDGHNQADLAEYPSLWLKNTLHEQSAQILNRQDERLNDLGEMCCLERLVDNLPTLHGVGLVEYGRYTERTRRWRLLTRNEIIKARALECPSYAREIVEAHAPPIEHLRTIYEVQAPSEPREVSATREQTNPLSGNGFYMVATDLQLFNAALRQWIKSAAPKLYHKPRAEGAKPRIRRKHHDT